MLIFPLLSPFFFLFTFGSSRLLDSGKFLPGGKSDYPQDVQAEILAKVEAFEGFVTLNTLALGWLPVLSLEARGLLYSPCNPLAQAFFAQNPPIPLLSKLLAANPHPLPNPDLLDLAP